VQRAIFISTIFPLDTMGEFITNSQTWNPNIDSKQRDHYLSKWNKAISKAKQWT